MPVAAENLFGSKGLDRLGGQHVTVVPTEALEVVVAEGDVDLFDDIHHLLCCCPRPLPGEIECAFDDRGGGYHHDVVDAFQRCFHQVKGADNTRLSGSVVVASEDDVEPVGVSLSLSLVGFNSPKHDHVADEGPVEEVAHVDVDVAGFPQLLEKRGPLAGLVFSPAFQGDPSLELPPQGGIANLGEYQFHRPSRAANSTRSCAIQSLNPSWAGPVCSRRMWFISTCSGEPLRPAMNEFISLANRKWQWLRKCRSYWRK